MQNSRLDKAQVGIKTARRNINNLRYADDTTLLAGSKEELKSLLMKVKEESEKAGLKLNIQKTKILTSNPITSWQIDGETMETVTDFTFLGSKLTADSDCSHEIKRHLLLGRKAMTNLDKSIKKQRHHFTNKYPYAFHYAFSSSHVQMGELNHKEGWAPKNWCFQTVVLEKTLESPLNSREIKLVNPTGNQPWIFIRRTDAEAEAPILWHVACQARLLSLWILEARILGWVAISFSKYFGYLMQRAHSLEKKLWCYERLRTGGQGVKEDVMVGRNHQLNEHEFEQTPGNSEGQGSLACCSPSGHKESDMTEWLNTTTLIILIVAIIILISILSLSQYAYSQSYSMDDYELLFFIQTVANFHIVCCCCTTHWFCLRNSRILEWVAISFSRDYSQSRDGTHVSCIGRQVLYQWATRKVQKCQHFRSLHLYLFAS